MKLRHTAITVAIACALGHSAWADEAAAKKWPGPLLGTDKKAQYKLITRPGECTDNETIVNMYFYWYE